MRRLSKGIYPGLICAIIIMVLMGLPGKCFPIVVSFWDWLGPDKIVHLVLFGTLCFISLWGYRNIFLKKNHQQKNKLFTLITLSCILYGGLTEILQKYLFINRYGSFLDFLADLIGCVLGYIIFIFVYKKKLKK